MSGTGVHFSGSRSAHRLDDPNKVRTADVLNSDNDKRQFSDLHFPEKILSGLVSAGFLRPSPIQWAALPLSKIGLDLIVQSKSGTGKTLVYVVTALNMIDTSVNAIQAVILTPTREIAVQGARISLDIAAVSMPDLKVSTLIGGMSVKDDTIKLKRCHMIVGTPGRVRQLIEEKYLKTDAVRFFALDEADKMLESSFKNDVTMIYNNLPEIKQVMALSATYPESLANSLTSLMRTPKHVRLDTSSQVLIGLDQYVLHTNYHPKPKYQLDIKFGVLLDVLNSVTFSQCLIFTNYSLSAQSICERLNGNGWPAIFIAATLQNQYERLQALNSLRQFTTRIMVTTDLSARGIDAANVTLVINFDVPWDSRTFLHRSGRAGRFGSRGINMTLAGKGEETEMLRKIVFRTGTKIKTIPYDTSPEVNENGDDNTGRNEYELPDFWKLETDLSKEIVEKYLLVEGLECPLEELEDQQKTESVKNHSSEELEPGKKKRKGNRRKKKNPETENKTGLLQNDKLGNSNAKPEIVKNNEEEYFDCNENEYYDYRGDEECLDQNGGYDYRNDEYYEDGEYYEGGYDEDYYNENEYYGEERERYEENGNGQGTNEWTPVSSSIIPTKTPEEDDVGVEYDGETDLFIVEQYALATGYQAPKYAKEKNTKENDISTKNNETYLEAKVLLSDFFNANFTQKTEKRFEKLLTYEELQGISKKLNNKEELGDSYRFDIKSNVVQSETKQFNTNSLLHAANVIQKYETEKWENKVQLLAQQIKESDIPKSDIIDLALKGDSITEILQRNQSRKITEVETDHKTSENEQPDPNSHSDKKIIESDFKVKKKEPASSLVDIFSSAEKSSKKLKPDGKTCKSKTSGFAKQQTTGFGDVGPDGLPKWVLVETDVVAINDMIPDENYSSEDLEVYHQGKHKIQK